jgi:hypothetical protein
MRMCVHIAVDKAVPLLFWLAPSSPCGFWFLFDLYFNVLPSKLKKQHRMYITRHFFLLAYLSFRKCPCSTLQCNRKPLWLIIHPGAPAEASISLSVLISDFPVCMCSLFVGALHSLSVLLWVDFRPAAFELCGITDCSIGASYRQETIHMQNEQRPFFFFSFFFFSCRSHVKIVTLRAK